LASSRHCWACSQYSFDEGMGTPPLPRKVNEFRTCMVPDISILDRPLVPTAPGSPLAAPVRLRGLIEWAPCECQFGCPIAVVNRLGTGGQRQKSARLAWEFGASPSGNSPRVPKSRAPAVAVRPGLLMSRWGAGGNATLVRIHRQPKSHRQIKSWLSSERTLGERPSCAGV
jgi:hypothetical protein